MFGIRRACFLWNERKDAKRREKKKTKQLKKKKKFDCRTVGTFTDFFGLDLFFLIYLLIKKIAH